MIRESSREYVNKEVYEMTFGVDDKVVDKFNSASPSISPDDIPNCILVPGRETM